MQPKNILVLVASIGSGHIKAGEAIIEGLRAEEEGLNVKMVDFSSWKISPLIAFLKSVYLFMLRFVPNLYELLYNFTGKDAGGFSAQSLISLATQRDIKKLIEKYQPDAIICTHPFPAGSVAMYRRAKKKAQRFFFATLITDYSMHRMWVYKEVDLYYVAISSMEKDLVAFGIEKDAIFVSGIPIMNEFFIRSDREEICKKFHLTHGIPIVLLMGGGLGLGNIETALKTLDRLEEKIQILVVTGKNIALKKRIQNMAKRSKHRIYVYGYSKDVSSFMQVADLLVSKPGALTITEAIARELPMVLHEPIPGPERENAVFISQKGLAICPLKNDLGIAILDLLRHKDQLKEMAREAKSMQSMHSASLIAQDILSHLYT